MGQVGRRAFSRASGIRLCRNALIGAAFFGAGAGACAAEDPEPGIWLEMGLLACERGETQEARRLFDHIERTFDPPPGIRALIAHTLHQSCPPRQSPKARLAAGFGWSSNVNLGPAHTHFLLPSGNTTLELRVAERFWPRSDAYVFTEGEAGFALGPGSLVPFGSLRKYSAAGDFDEGVLGVAYQFDERPLADGRWHGSLTLAQSFLGGARYAELRGLGYAYRQSAFSLSAHGQAIDYPQAPAFDARQLALRAGVGLQYGRWRAALRLGGLLDLAVHPDRPGGDRSGWLADLHATRPGPGGAQIEFVWRGESSQTRRAYLPGLFEMRRVRHFNQFEVAWQIPQSRTSAWRLSAALTNATDSVPFLGYRQTHLSAAWIWTLR